MKVVSLMNLFENAVTYDLLIGLQGLYQRGWDVVHGENDFSDSSLSESLDLVAQNRLVTEEDKGLGNTESEGSETSAVSADQD